MIESALDYVTAAVVYLANDVDSPKPTAFTLSELRSNMQKFYNIYLPERALRFASEDLERHGIVEIERNRFGSDFIGISRNFGALVAGWRIENPDASAVRIFNKFMMGSHDWMKKALADDSFKRELDDEIVARELPSGQLVWRPLSYGFRLKPDELSQLVRLLDEVEEKIPSTGASQEDQAQARSYIIAARVLSEAPEPQSDLIWEILGRANSIAGIASLLVSIIALFLR